MVAVAFSVHYPFLQRPTICIAPQKAIQTTGQKKKQKKSPDPEKKKFQNVKYRKSVK